MGVTPESETTMTDVQAAAEAEKARKAAESNAANDTGALDVVLGAAEIALEVAMTASTAVAEGVASCVCSIVDGL